MIYTAEEKVGKVRRFFPRISVAVVAVEPLFTATLKIGETIRITGEGSRSFKKTRINFVQKVESMEINHAKIEEAKPGDVIGLKVIEEALEGCCVFKI